MSNLPAKLQETAEKLSASVTSVLGSAETDAFTKAFTIAEATTSIKGLLTNEVMGSIMALQGSKLGFKTDKDDKGGYPVGVVRDCLMEAVLTGVQPVGNQFNIISGNCYITKEGFGYLLKNIPTLSYELIFGIPVIDASKKSATVKVDIKWTYKGKSETRSIDFPIKSNEYMGVDGVLGKATRKARAWLYTTITNVEISDGDAEEVPVVEIGAVKEIPSEAKSDTTGKDPKDPITFVPQLVGEHPRKQPKVAAYLQYIQTETKMAEKRIRDAFNDWRTTLEGWNPELKDFLEQGRAEDLAAFAEYLMQM